MLYFYRNAIKLNHEFLADDSAISAIQNVILYQQLLLSKLVSPQIQLTSNLNFKLTKQRFTMMTKRTSPFTSAAKRLLACSLFLISTFLFAEFSVAQTADVIEKKQAPPVQAVQKPAKKSGKLTKDDVDYKNGDYTIMRDFIPGQTKSGWGNRLKYSELTEEEKKLPFTLMYFAKTPVPTNEMYNNWLNPKVVGLWIDGKKVKNSELKKYKKSDIGHYFVSFVHLNTRQPENYKYQVDLMTHDQYDKYIEEVKKDPSFTIDLRTKK
jgi:hypothetical protein